MNGAGIFFLILLFVVILPLLSWAVFVRWRAHRSGLPAPPLAAYNPFSRSPSSNYPIAPRRGGALGWIGDKFAALRNKATSGGGAGYESSRVPNRGFGPLDPDGAWDDRVGHEADTGYGRVGDDDDTELGLHPGGYGGQGYGRGAGNAGGGAALPGYGEERGRSRSRDDVSYVGGGQSGLDRRYDEEVHGGGHGATLDPFGEHAERSSLRGVSPRPVEMDARQAVGHKKKGSGGTTKSGHSGRQSMFHEDM
jgi:hypothetical protein